MVKKKKIMEMVYVAKAMWAIIFSWAIPSWSAWGQFSCSTARSIFALSKAFWRMGMGSKANRTVRVEQPDTVLPRDVLSRLSLP